MKNCKIDWGKITEEEAQDILRLIQSLFNIVVKIKGSEKWHTIRYFETRGKYDDNFYGDK